MAANIIDDLKARSGVGVGHQSAEPELLVGETSTAKSCFAQLANFRVRVV